MVEWTVVSKTVLKECYVKKLPMEQLEKYGVRLAPVVHHVDDNKGAERHVMSTKEYAAGEELRIGDYVLITKGGLYSKSDPAGKLSLEHSGDPLMAGNSDICGTDPQLEYAVVVPEVWQPIAAAIDVAIRFGRAIAEVAIARRDNPDMSMDHAVKEARNLIKRRGH